MSTDNPSSPLPKVPIPLEHIALSLSGGGYRAAAYHLGTMAYLDHCQYKGKSLLESVKVLSSISGGTITAAMYAHHLAQEKTFQDCFDKLYLLLQEDNLVSQALDKLNHPSTWDNKYKTKDLINAFSEVYNEHFYGGATFERFDLEKMHLDDVTFGSVEFATGHKFRFIESREQARFGNGKVNLSKDVYPNIKIGDAVAASSCFPGGFEPMIMPRDFSDGSDSAISKYWADKGKDNPLYEATAIMDGGVVDNQGIQSIQQAESRYTDNGTKHPVIGTFIISDVAAKDMDPFKVPELNDSRPGNWVSINVINGIAVITPLLAAMAVCCFHSTWTVVLLTFLLTLSVIWGFLYFFARKKLKNAVQSKFGEQHVSVITQNLALIQKTPIYILIYLIKFRVTSVLKMVLDVFLRRIRKLQIDQVYGDKKWIYRTFSNNIYRLHGKSEFPDSIKEIIDKANSMPTTLWFSQADKDGKMLDALIICGQMNICYNLIQYIDGLIKSTAKKEITKKVDGKNIKVLNPEYEMDTKDPTKNFWNMVEEEERGLLLELKEQLEGDLAKFKTAPSWLLE